MKQEYEATSMVYKSEISDYVHKIDEAKGKLKDLEDKQAAYLAAKQRQEEIDKKEDYYRLVISEDDKSDIKMLRDIQKHLIKKDGIDKSIYETYYRPAYDILMTHLFKNKDKVSGIYRLTDRSTGLSYVGQSTDCRNRLKTHIKTALSSDSATNKLYQQMKKSGVDNFIFEFLEEVPKEKLNEREVYYIQLYDTKNSGLNRTIGGS